MVWIQKLSNWILHGGNNYDALRRQLSAVGVWHEAFDIHTGNDAIEGFMGVFKDIPDGTCYLIVTFGCYYCFNEKQKYIGSFTPDSNTFVPWRKNDI